MKALLRKVAAAVLAACAGTYSVAAHAHSIDLFAHAVGDEIHGSVTFGDGSPAPGVTVEVSWNPPGAIHEGDQNAATIQTDEAGKFVFKPVASAAHLFICRTDDGHRAARTVPFGVDEEGAQKPGHESVQNQIAALREQLHEYESRIRLRDVLGGIGYILGLAGVAALMKSRRRPS
jgi:nickel transport protein